MCIVFVPAYAAVAATILFVRFVLLQTSMQSYRKKSTAAKYTRARPYLKCEKYACMQ